MGKEKIHPESTVTTEKRGTTLHFYLKDGARISADDVRGTILGRLRVAKMAESSRANIHPHDAKLRALSAFNVRASIGTITETKHFLRNTIIHASPRDLSQETKHHVKTQSSVPRR